MKIVFVIIYLLFTVTIFGQDFHYPNLKKSYETVSEIAPADWKIFDYKEGDLNGDNVKDLAVILEYKDEVTENRPNATSVKTKPRILLVFFKAKNGKYNLMLQHNTFLLRDNEDMQPEVLPELTITNGVLSIHYDLFHDYPTYKVRFQKGDFYLIGANLYGFHGSQYSEDDINLVTGEFHQIYYAVGDEKNAKRKSFRLKTLKPIKFTEFKMPLTYKISDDYDL